MDTPAIEVAELTHRYGDRMALRQLSLEVASGEIFAVLGPNGGGKSTLFRLLATLATVQEGSVRILGVDVARQPAAVRGQIGVVFQAPGLDKKLTVAENLRYHGQLFGLRGPALERRIDEMLERLGVADRRSARVETLSGGLARRVELAKGMLHAPRVLLLDEPSTGLDPGARSDLWQYLEHVREHDRVTVALTTHLLDEAEKADRIAILDRGRLVALDTPAALRATVGGDSITIQTDEPAELAAAVEARFGYSARALPGAVRLEVADGHHRVAELAEALGSRIRSITVGHPTLEDVFIARTGHRFWSEENRDPEAAA